MDIMKSFMILVWNQRNFKPGVHKNFQNRREKRKKNVKKPGKRQIQK